MDEKKGVIRVTDYKQTVVITDNNNGTSCSKLQCMYNDNSYCCVEWTDFIFLSKIRWGFVLRAELRLVLAV